MNQIYKATLSQYALPPSLPSWGDLEGCSLKTMMFEKYPSISPYTYCANNPMKYVDPTGEEIDVTFLPQEVRNKLITSLNKITGLNLGTKKNEKGFTVLTYSGEVNEEGTSTTARDILINAINNPLKVEVGVKKEGSKGIGLGIGLDILEIQGFIDGVQGGLNPETMGFGMTFLHELDHTDLGRKTTHSFAESICFGKIGTTLSLMNTIRNELGADYGERKSYKSKSIGNFDYLPFDSSACFDLKDNKLPWIGKYIEYKK